jgi:tetratricopeptide (TPR) repeat protein
MTTATPTTFDVIALGDIEPGPEHDGRVPLNIRRHFDIRGFGIRANRAVGEGHIVGEHDEVGLGGSGQEELYLVLSGAATFTVGEEQIDAPTGTLVFVRDPATRRGAVAKEEGTTVLAIGGTPGKPYELAIGELMSPMWDRYRAEDYEGALAALQPVLDERPQALVFFNVACMEARLGRTDDAIAHLRQAVEDDDRIKEHIRTDEDLTSLREDPRFGELAA